jgi:hypothetical protein
LSTTGASQLIHIGHSQGTAQAFAGYSINPKLASQVKLFVGKPSNHLKTLALAPVAYMQFIDSLVVEILSAVPSQYVFDILGKRGFPPVTWWFELLQSIVPLECETTPLLCENTIFIIGITFRDYSKIIRWVQHQRQL